MPSQKVEQWGIHFVITSNRAGYEWRKEPIAGRIRTREVLCVAGSIVEPRPGTIAFRGVTAATVSRPGIATAKRACQRFRNIAETITRFESGNAGHTRVTPDEEIKEIIVRYANDFGTLWGDEEPRTVNDWVREAVRYLDLCDISHALQTGDYHEFNQRVQDWGDEVVFRSKRIGFTWMRIAKEGDFIEEGESTNALATRVDLLERARQSKKGQPKNNAILVFSRQINRIMANGLSLQANVLSEKKAYIAPNSLLHLLYMRMWLDVLDKPGLVRQATCLNGCGTELDTKSVTKRRKFCSDKCRTEFHNRQRSAA